MEPDQDPQVKPEDDEIRTPGEDGWQPPKDGTWVPVTRMDKAVGQVKDRATELEIDLRKERETRIRLEERLSLEEKTKGASTEVTRDQLRREVEAQKLTQDQADDIWLNQQRKSWKAEMQQEASQQREEDQQTRLIDDQIAAYTRACPEVNENGTEERKKVTREFNELVRMGQPNTHSTELLALRAVFGPSDKLTELRSKRAAHSETSTGANEDGRPTPSNPSLRQERQRKYYDGLVQKGIITKEDAEKDLKYASGV